MSLMNRVDEWLAYAVSAAYHGCLDDEQLADLRGVRQALNGYVLVHKSHVTTQQEFDMSKAAYLTRAYVMAQKIDIAPEIEILYATQGRDVCLDQHKDWAVTVLFRYLEQPAPDPEQTQPDQP